MADTGYSGLGRFAKYLERVPAAFAVTRGAQHMLVYANAEFRRLTGPAGDAPLGIPLTAALAGREASSLIAVLDQAFRTGAAARNQPIESLDGGGPTWCCTVWPEMDKHGEPEHLVIEVRAGTQAELTLAFQREVVERMLLSALRELSRAEIAEASRQRATFLAAEGRRLSQSLDESATRDAVSALSLPNGGSWCIVDLLQDDRTMRRLAIIHPDPATQALLRGLAGRWQPEPGDLFGVPAVLRSAQLTVIADDIDDVVAAAAHDSETLRILQAVNVGHLLTVPLLLHDRLIGAITFVAGRRDRGFTDADIELAENLALRSATALDSARMHGEAVALKVQAEVASRAKSAFLGTMSHELRTPLNAIGGYVDLIDMGLRGPVTEAQRVDLARIRANQKHLMALINDVLNFVRVGSGRMQYEVAEVVAHDAVAASVAIVDPLILQKQLVLDLDSCDAAVTALADREKVIQILVNLLSNAVKFTPPGGRIAIACEATEQTVLMRIADTGIGVPPDKLATIFEPFVQVTNALAGRASGIGLGLAISRDLARGMGGDLACESELGIGATFTLSLPAARVTHTAD